MNTHYTTEKNVQIVIALLKAHGIKKIIASPGATNVTFVASIQSDPFFEIYSSVDERSAAYIACGLAAESGEPVALSCTGATASRNYIPGLTEAFYRKLPVLAITSTQNTGRIGHNVPQVIDRSVLANDIAKFNLEVPCVYDEETEWACKINVNKALLALTKDGGGPVHLNLETRYSPDFTVKELPSVTQVKRITIDDVFPNLPAGRIIIYVGSHKKWSSEETSVVEKFCELYDSVVFEDLTGNYKGKYKISSNLFCNQAQYSSTCKKSELVIHIGEVAGGYPSFDTNNFWRVSCDGEVCDTYRKLTNVFQMSEIDFFKHYCELKEQTTENKFYTECKTEYTKFYNKIPELPFGNIWIAKQTASKLPNNSVLHLGILNTLRSWNFFEISDSILCYSNTGGFGIDGDMSSLIGASLYDKSKLYFGIFGDLAFFYDMNVIGNHNVGNNVRIMLINNGRGTEFRNYNHPAARFGDDADKYMAAAGHFGNKSPELIKNYAEDLGYEYLSAKDKNEYLEVSKKFLTPELTSKPIIFEVFTDSMNESDALKTINNLEKNVEGSAKSVIKEIIGVNNVQKLKKMLGK